MSFKVDRHSERRCHVARVGTDAGIENDLIKNMAAVEKRIRREINYTFYLHEEFATKLKRNDPFLENIRLNKHIVLKETPW